MPKSIYIQYLSEYPNANPHYLNRLIKILIYFSSIEPKDKPFDYESHHIVPKSWKPEWKNEKDNLLKVSYRVHYLIHYLMWRSFPKDSKMMLSFWKMNNQKTKKILSKLYDQSKIAFIKNHPNKTAEAREKAREKTLNQFLKNGHPSIGLHHTNEARLKISNARKRNTPF